MRNGFSADPCYQAGYQAGFVIVEVHVLFRASGTFIIPVIFAIAEGT